MCAASGVHARVASADLPLLPGRRAPRARGTGAGRLAAQPPAADDYADVAHGVDPVRALLACDAQTSGGLLAAVPPGQWGTVGWVIGEIVPGPAGRITLV